ncbi:MAG: hypothetical protein BA862_10465 [Desulfobulbaceae bacterium S3730MH12]|nr:MAG: hypothetical protein BA862_10465 [Desulfobulbaceae bacterium S3730MH12]
MIFILLPFLYLFNYSLSTLVSINLFDREDDIVLVYGTVMRNLPIPLRCLLQSIFLVGKMLILFVKQKLHEKLKSLQIRVTLHQGVLLHNGIKSTLISPASIHYSAAMMHLGQDWP